jgi:hypothetical protein
MVKVEFKFWTQSFTGTALTLPSEFLETDTKNYLRVFSFTPL